MSVFILLRTGGQKLGNGQLLLLLQLQLKWAKIYSLRNWVNFHDNLYTISRWLIKGWTYDSEFNNANYRKSTEKKTNVLLTLTRPKPALAALTQMISVKHSKIKRRKKLWQHILISPSSSVLLNRAPCSIWRKRLPNIEIDADSVLYCEDSPSSK